MQAGNRSKSEFKGREYDNRPRCPLRMLGNSRQIGKKLPRDRLVGESAGWLGSICRDFGLNVRVNLTGRSPPARRPLPRDACWGRTADGGHRQWSVVLRQSDPSHPPSVRVRLLPGLRRVPPRRFQPNDETQRTSATAAPMGFSES